jgi:hypothetical protein
MESQEFEIVGAVEQIETIAVGQRIRELANLKRMFGTGRWRKLKGRATIRCPNGVIARAELHWYEAHGIGRRKMKLKHFWFE